MAVKPRFPRARVLLVVLAVILPSPLHAALRFFQFEAPLDRWVDAVVAGNGLEARQIRTEACASLEGRSKVQCLARFAALEAGLGWEPSARELFAEGRRLAADGRDVLGLCVLWMIERDIAKAESLAVPPTEEGLSELCLRLEEAPEGEKTTVTRVLSPVEIWAEEALAGLAIEEIPGGVVVDLSWDPAGFHRHTLLTMARLLTFLGERDKARLLLRRVVELGGRVRQLLEALSGRGHTSSTLIARSASEDAAEAIHLLCYVELPEGDRSRSEAPCVESLRLQLASLGPGAAGLRAEVLFELLFAVLAGDLKSAEEVLHSGLALPDSPPLVAIHQYFLGGILLAQARYDEALAAGLRVLDIARGLDDRMGQINALLLVGEAYEGLGLLEAGIDSLEEAEQLARELNSPEHVRRVRVKQAEWFARLNRFEEAQVACDEAQGLLPGGDLEAWQQVEACALLSRPKNPATSVFADDVPLFREHWLAKYEDHLQAGAGLLESSPGEAAEAFSQAEELVLGKEVALGALVVAARFGRAVAEGRRGRCDASRRLLDEVSEMKGLDVWTPNLSRFGPLAALAQSTGSVDFGLATVYAQMGVVDKALRHSERARAQAFRHGAGAGWLEQSTGAPGWDLAAMGDRCAALSARLLSRTAPSSLGDGAGAGWRELEDCQEEYRLRVADVVARDPRRAVVSGARVEPLAAIQEQLARFDQEMVVYFRTGTVYVAIVLAGDDARLVPIDEDPQELDWKVRLFRTLTMARSEDPGRHVKLARELYEVLWKPLRSALKSDRVVLVPHQQLHDLPFVALMSGDHRWLGEQFTLSYAPSASAWVALTDREPLLRSQEAEVSILADPHGSLPGAARTARTIATLWNAEAHLGSAASEALLRRATGRRLLHLATHASVDPAHPFATYLNLAPGEGQDGRLELREILGLPLSGVELVVLATCRSSEGQRSDRDDSSSLSRAFLTAGARAVVSADWSIDDDATAAFMATFHRSLRDGRGADEALQEAQAVLFSGSEWADPYFWAAFRVQGAVDPPRAPRR